MHETAADTAAGGGPLEDRWTETLDRLRAFIAARIGDQQAAADITQDVLVRSIASGALARVDNPIGWLYRSAQNAVIDHYRTRRRHEPLDRRTDRSPAETADDDRPNSATQELARCLHPLVQGLAPIYRGAVTRVDLDGETHQHAAETRHQRLGHEITRPARPPSTQKNADPMLRRQPRPNGRRRQLPARRQNL